MKSHFFQLAPGTRPRRALALAAVGAAVLPATLMLAGCGQNFHQDGGVQPVPQPTSSGLNVTTPAPATDAPNQPRIGPGYAPPRTGGPTETVVPGLPGGKY